MRISKLLSKALLLVALLSTGLMGCVTTADGHDNVEMSALELANAMGNGTNLGNTMEAYGHFSPGINMAPEVYETLWGQPVTTQEMLYAMKEAGFDSIRIPVAWTNTMDFMNDDFTISPAYLDRVETIVNYALNADMYVVVNDHWDGGWWGMFGSARPEIRQKAMDLYIAMWTQVAERFKDYSNMLILESGNEELGDRLNDVTNITEDSDTLSVDECYETANKINQQFVETIRSSGGNNKNRFLLIAGYNTNIDMTIDDRFKMPMDTAEDKLLISVHYYDPWSYCGTNGVTQWGNQKEYMNQLRSLAKMTKFTDQGYGVIIGEYGALPMDGGELKDNTVDFTRSILDNCDLNGFVPMLWDTSSFFKRTELKMVDQDLADLFLKRSLTAQSIYSEQEIRDRAEKSLEQSIDAAEPYLPPSLTLDGSQRAVAWIMYSSNDGSVTYSVGDEYMPSSMTKGIVPTDVIIEEAGTYSVSLDFTGTTAGSANSMMFSALGISYGEMLFPGYIIDIEEILINGEPYQMTGRPYTTSDNRICTRVNLFNGWVKDIPPEARTMDGDVSDVSAAIIDKKTLGPVETIEITFSYGPAIAE